MSSARIAKATLLWILLALYIAAGSTLLAVVLTNPVRPTDLVQGLAVAGGFILSAVTLFSERQRLRTPMVALLTFPVAILWTWINNLHEL